MKSLMIKIVKTVSRILFVIIIGVVCAVIGFIVTANLAAVYELISGQPFVLNGRESVEAAGPIGLILGGLTGLVGSGVVFFGGQTRKSIH
ncbi:MAG: hypothetical protein IPM53_00675 [Anaerolineaceae bacterium]|nr:hypothetical protein [Anaerolineaceae bacterium]